MTAKVYEDVRITAKVGPSHQDYVDLLTGLRQQKNAAIGVSEDTRYLWDWVEGHPFHDQLDDLRHFGRRERERLDQAIRLPDSERPWLRQPAPEPNRTLAEAKPTS